MKTEYNWPLIKCTFKYFVSLVNCHQIDQYKYLNAYIKLLIIIIYVINELILNHLTAIKYVSISFIKFEHGNVFSFLFC